MFSPLRSRTYRHLFAAQVIALLGTGLATVALGLVAYQLAGAQAGAVLGTALAIKMVDYVGVAPVAGALRWSRKKRLTCIDAGCASSRLHFPISTSVVNIQAKPPLTYWRATSIFASSSMSSGLFRCVSS